MPLARITTPLAEFYDRLAQDLRARGFDVQNAHPGQFFPEAADLEITVKQCSPEEAARYAADASAKKDMCVLVTPSGRQGNVRSIEMIVVQPKAEFEVLRAGVTPAQVIEISSVLASSVHLGVESVAPRQAVRQTAGQRAGNAARSSWEEINKTTNRWLNGGKAGCSHSWQLFQRASLPARAFFWEVCDETRQLYKRIAGSVVPGNKSAKRLEEDESLVPSMFHLSESIDSSDDSSQAEGFVRKVVVQMPERERSRRLARDVRFLKVSSAAGVAAVAVLLAATLMHRAPAPTAANQHSSDPKPVTPASATIKPSAMIDRNGDHRPTGVQMISARQVSNEESGVDDTVVRYGRRAPSPRPQSNPYEIKHYSDLD